MESNIPKKLKIGIAGAGGIGSHLVALLYDFGANRNQFPFSDYIIDVYDDDIIEVTNLLHQNFSEQDIGNSKVGSLSERYAINPSQRFMTKDDFGNYDVILCGVDSMNFRRALYEWSWQNPTKGFWIDGRCTSRQGCVFNKTVSKEKLEKMLGELKDGPEERTGCLLEFEKKQETAHVLPIITAGIMLQMFLNYLRGHQPLTEKMYMF
jgi:molybdopterin/thiamine biosynthesis adenylyltransferase